MADQALVDNVIQSARRSYRDAGTAMKALIDGADVLTPPQILSILAAIMDESNKNNQLSGAYDADVWPERASQGIMRAFVEKYLLKASFDISALDQTQTMNFFRALSYCCENAVGYGH